LASIKIQYGDLEKTVMSRIRCTRLAIALTTSMAIVFAGISTKTAFARGGGGHGGGHHGGGHHGGHHPYHPSHHHTAHHEHHHDHHHYHHHHHSWHNGGWGPGFWGGLGLGALGGWYAGGWGGYGGGNYGGDTYVDNSASTVDNSSTQSTLENTTTAAQQDQQQQGGEGANANGFPVDDWPELGIVTYAGQYGNKQGMVVVRVVPNSAAARAGFVPGDVILKLNDQPTANADALETVLDGAKGVFEASVWDARTGRQSTLTGTFEPSPTAINDDAQPQPSASGPTPALGR
jgi:membrane-associated protease RseP (regulator of RpoE activity)